MPVEIPPPDVASVTAPLSYFMEKFNEASAAFASTPLAKSLDSTRPLSHAIKMVVETAENAPPKPDATAVVRHLCRVFGDTLLHDQCFVQHGLNSIIKCTLTGPNAPDHFR